MYIYFFEHVVHYCYLLQTNLKVDKDNLILVFGKGSLHAISSIDGEVLWKKEIAPERYADLEFYA